MMITCVSPERFHPLIGDSNAPARREFEGFTIVE